MEQITIDSIGQQLQQLIASRSLSLPMLPQVTTQVLSLVNDIDSDAAALAKLIQNDQALAGHVMRIANSAAYSPTAKMASLQQATARLGMQNISEIAMAATMGPKLFKAPGYDEVIKDIWQSSLAIAVWAREIARLGRRNVESTFLCGLLCQIGKPVVLQTVLEVAHKENITVDIDGVEKLIGLYQAQTGAVLAEHWQLPSAVQETILGLDGGSEDSSKDIIETVRAAKVFAKSTLDDATYDVDALSTNESVIAINLYDDDVKQLLLKADSIHDTIKELSV